MDLERGSDRVWRQQPNSEPLASSPEDLMIAAEDAKERTGRVTRAVDELKATIDKKIAEDESGEKTLEGKSE